MTDCVRLQTNISPEVAETLKRLAEKKGASVTEVVAWATELYDFIEKVKPNKNILLEDQLTGSTDRVVFHR